MHVPPSTVGNVDSDGPQVVQGPPQFVLVDASGQGPQFVIVQPVEAFPNPLPKKCLWALLLLCCLLVLRVQQDNYSEVVRVRGQGMPDEGKPFPWELRALASGNDSFEATFLSPLLETTSTFVNPEGSRDTVFTSLGHSFAVGTPSALEPRRPGGLTATGFAIASSTTLSLPGCPANHTATCFVGLQNVYPARDAEVTCHRFMVGSSPHAMSPLATGLGHDALDTPMLCLGSRTVRSVVPVETAGSGNDTVIVVWDVPSTRGSRSTRGSMSCLASVSVPSMEVRSVSAVGALSAVLYDQATTQVLTFGFSSAAALVAYAFEPWTLGARWRFRLPLSSAWLLKARVSDGFLLFLGTEDPFFGATFAVDLRNSQVYEQDPPVGGSHRPRRRHLPSELAGMRLVERLRGRAGSQDAKAEAGPCAVKVMPAL